MITYVYPPTAVSVAVPPIEFKLDGADTTVSRDTVTPGNSHPLPVINLDSSGSPASPLTDAELRASAVPISATALPLPAGAATEAKQDAIITDLGDLLTELQLKANLTDTQPVSGPLTDAQLRASAVPVSGTFFQATQPISASSLPLPTGASTEAKQDAEAVLIGAVNETAPTTDTASSGLNGRLQRIAQRLTSLIALLPASLGQKTMANSLAVTLASDQSSLSVTQASLVGTYDEITNLTNSAQTFTAPAGARWAKIQADNTNTSNIRWKIGAAATTTSGMQLEPGRSEDISGVGNISVICETADTNQKVYVQWGN